MRGKLPYALAAATSFGFLLVQLDVSIVNVALVAMDASLRAGVAGLQWIVDAYTLTFAAFLLLAGSLGDRVGVRITFLAGFALFLVASLSCGLAPNLGVLIPARAVQGFGAALMVPSSLAILNHACADDAGLRARAVGLWTAAGSVGLALGPVIGGLLISVFNWRAIFLVNLPIGLFGIWLTLRSVSETKGAGGHFDWPGQALAIIALTGLVGASIEAGSLGWSSPVVLGGLAVALVALAAFVVVEQHARSPLLPLEFLRRPAFGMALAVGAAVNFTFYGILFIVSFYLQRLHHYSPMATGWTFLPATVAIGIANVLAGSVAERTGTRALMIAGLLAGMLGLVLLYGLGGQASLPAIVAGLVMLGAGIGTTVPAMTSSLLAAAPRERGGLASGVLNTVRQAAGAMGVAIFGTLISVDAAHGAATACLIGLPLMLLAIAAAWAAGSAPHKTTARA